MNRRDIPVLLFAALCFSGCEKERWDDCFTPTGSIVMDERSVPAFTEVDISDKIDLVLTEAGEDRLVVEAGKGLLEQIRTEVIGGTLVIRNENTCNWVRRFNVPITVHLSCSSLEQVTYRGTGSITCTNPITTPHFRFHSERGAGNVDLQLDVAGCYFGLFDGTANVTITGQCIEAWYYTFGFGHIRAHDFHTQICHPHNNCSGDITCYASEEVAATIDNAGDIYYTGDPDSVHLNASGTGQLIEM